ncbi:MAG TPA: ribonuclease H family protein [Saprospiraceae bacterium]|nr:ribonuclease H family protein [Saprospiraceae bacterium]
MAGKKKKFYVVWKGKKPGIYNSWDACLQQVKGYPDAQYKSFKTLKDAEEAFSKNFEHVSSSQKKKKKYYVIWDGPRSAIYTDWNKAKEKIKGLPMTHLKTFGSRILAERALEEGPEKYIGKDFRKTKDLSEKELAVLGTPIELSLCVDAAYSDKTNLTEYRGVWTFHTEEEVFRAGPFTGGSNNIGEFLAIVHALAWLNNHQDSKMKDLPIYSDSKYAMKWIENKQCNSKKLNEPKIIQLVRRAEKWLKNNNHKNPILKWQTKAWGEIPADFGRK